MSENRTKHKNNFDFLRLLFALFVLIAHSYALAGSQEHDWLYQLTNGQIVLGFIGLRGFFIISGYLIFKSMKRSRNFIDFYRNRFLRIFPALFVVLVLTVLLGPFVYIGDLTSYVNNKTVQTYIPNNLSLYNIQTDIQGIFHHNPYKSIINGCLWTLPYEATMYLLLSLLFIVRKHQKTTLVLMGISFSLLAIGSLFFSKELGIWRYVLTSKDLMNVGLFFVAGALLSALNIERTRHANILLYVSCGLLVLALTVGLYDALSVFLLPIAIVLFGLRQTPVINALSSRVGDLSYGIYIYGFPVQQTLQHFFRMDYLPLMLVSIAVTGILAYGSWHLVERPALGLKTVRWRVRKSASLAFR